MANGLQLEWCRAGQYLVATMDCAGNPGRLMSGNLGWFMKGTATWIQGWSLQFESSFVLKRSATAAAAPMWVLPGTSLLVVVPETTAEAILCTNGTDLVRIGFRIPNCLIELTKGGFGCVATVRIPFRLTGNGLTCDWLCTARLFARAPGAQWVLTLVNGGVELRQTSLGKVASTVPVGNQTGNWDFGVLAL